MGERRDLGDRGEAAVAAYLRERGCRVLDSQFRCRYGEIDLIAQEPGGTICFVEVKTRSDSRFAQARECVTPAKQRRLRTAALVYLSRGGQDCPCRFDVAEVYPGAAGDWGAPQINYIINAF